MIQRPLFSEGQILGADDLQEALDYSRDQDARHARIVHTWGIAYGLTVEHSKGDLYIEPGMAIDSSGAVIVVSTRTLIPPSVLTDRIGNQKDGSYPLFLLGQRDTSVSPQQIGRCSSGQGNRVTETALIQFAPQVGPNWDDQRLPPIGEGPDDDGPVSDRRILLGFADWEKATKEFKGFKLTAKGFDGIVPRYIGIRADTLESVSGELTLRTESADDADSKDAPMVVMSRVQENDPERVVFAFGADDGNGRIRRVFRIDDKGNVKSTGTIKGDITEVQDQTLVQSGTLTDGVRVPLPSGINDEGAANSSVAVHISLTPRFDLASKPKPEVEWLPVAERCFVADEDRRVECVFRWINPTTNPVGDEVRPGVCDYLIVVNVPATTRSSAS